MKRNTQTRTGLGAASLMMILLVLCLALLGVLSLMSARQDVTLSRRHAQLATGVAEASAQVQRALAALDEALCDAYRNAKGGEDYTERCMSIDSLDEADVAWLDEETALLSVDAGEERQIEVTIRRVSWEKAPECRFVIAAHQLVDAKEWGQTESLVLIDMGF